MPTRAELKKEKNRRLREIIEAVRLYPRPFNELWESFKHENIGDRMFKNYLAELVGIGVVILDPETGLYSWFEHKRTYTKAEREIALEHSKDITLSNEKWQGFDQRTPYGAIRSMASEDNPDFTAFVQHLKTGYTEVWQLLQKYKEKKKLLPDWGVNHFLMPKREASSNEDRLRAELEALEKKLIGEVYFIVERVYYRTPLDGVCSYCPTNEIRIVS